MNDNSGNPMLKAALGYAKRGWKVFPLKGKKPQRGTKGFLDASTDRAQIRAWWKKWPESNVGIACDSQTGPIVVDIDGRSGFRLLKALKLPATLEASSRTGRLHLYYDPMLDGTSIARRIRIRKDGVKHRLDILGDGGYVVAPPSIHPDTGKPYSWLNKKSLVPFPTSLLYLTQHGDEKKRAAEPLPDQINEGQRDQLLTSLAGSMRRRGASEEAILAALREENATRVNPPLPDKDLKRISKSIARKKPVEEAENLTDMGNARRFIRSFGRDVKHIPSNKTPWLLYEGTHWEPDKTGEVERMAKKVVRGLYEEAMALTDSDSKDNLLKHATRSEQSSRLKAILEVAGSEPEISVMPISFDRDPWLFNVENGTINLKTGKLQRHDRDDLITQIAPVEYDPNARAPRWERFLMEIMNNDVELVEFLQRAIGYALTGDTKEQCLFFCYGQGSNGKSTFLETIREMMGNYAQQTDFTTLLSRKSDGPRNDIARMQGVRYITASEADSEKSFDSTVIKLLTGGDKVTARKLYEEFKEFKPEHKLFLAANHKPFVKEQTEAFWRRIRLIPFTVTFSSKSRDKRLTEKLKEEMPGILTWAVEGCLRWQKRGLSIPTEVRRATQAYREENDLVGEFFGHCCRFEKKSWVSTTDLYQTFASWWLATRGPRTPPISMGLFTRMLSEREGLTSSKRGEYRGWKGVAIIQTLGA